MKFVNEFLNATKNLKCVLYNIITERLYEYCCKLLQKHTT